MYELPERMRQAQQVDEAIRGRTVTEVEAAHTPHGFAWYTGDPAMYTGMLMGKVVKGACYDAGALRITVGDMDLLITTLIKLYPPGKKLPDKHQLLLGFDDGIHLVFSVTMWGAMFCFPSAQDAKWLPHGHIRTEQLNPLEEGFTLEHLKSLLPQEGKLSVKGLLATGQRIPDLGNGMVQDILFEAGLRPMHDAFALTEEQWKRLYDATCQVTRRMVEQGGRDTEKDLYGNPGGYRTILSRKTVESPCPRCGGSITRKAYLGGNVYYCESCQE